MHSPDLAKRVDVDEKVTVLHNADECRRSSSGEKDKPDQEHDQSSFTPTRSRARPLMGAGAITSTYPQSGEPNPLVRRRLRTAMDREMGARDIR
jgi:hypothetical protein